jgi:hypothetical protein
MKHCFIVVWQKCCRADIVQTNKTSVHYAFPVTMGFPAVQANIARQKGQTMLALCVPTLVMTPPDLQSCN